MVYCVLQLKIGLWIDLTNTSRYYDPDVIRDAGIEYHKLKMSGHGQPPTREQLKKFFSIVEDFYKERVNRMEVVGVHCTHGFNRTGYLIVSFMVEKIGYPVEAALQEFAANRPPGIYRQEYVNELMQKYNSPRRPPIVRPPMWAERRASADSPERRRSKDRDRKRSYQVRRSSTSDEGEQDSKSDRSRKRQRESKLSRSPVRRRKS